MKRTRTIAALAVASSLLFASCGSSDSDGGSDTPSTEAPASDAPTTEAGGGASGDAVTIADFAFDPTPLEVAAGTAVTFTNEDSDAHTATSTGDVPKDFDTGDLAEGDSKEVTFDEAGTYTYYCSIHEYMKGEIDVK